MYQISLEKPHLIRGLIKIGTPVKIYIFYVFLSSDCPQPPSITAIIGGSIASVAFLGILLLMLIKLLIYMNDLKEYKKFEKEKKKSKWAEVRLFLLLFLFFFFILRSMSQQFQ